MQIEYTEDESRIRWERNGKWKSADLDQLIEAYEAEPKHGRWIKLYHGNYKCSECGEWWGSDYNDEVINDFNYCPNCGAKMDLDEVEE